MYFKTKFALKIISVSERDESKTKIKDRLRKLISKRPPIEELEKKGIIKGNWSLQWFVFLLIGV